MQIEPQEVKVIGPVGRFVFMKEGTVSRVCDDGYFYIDCLSENVKYIVSATHSIPNYKGESLKELGIKPGMKIKFTTISSDINSNGSIVDKIYLGEN